MTVSHCCEGTFEQMVSLTEKHWGIFSTLYLVVHTDTESSEHLRELDVVQTCCGTEEHVVVSTLAHTLSVPWLHLKSKICR